jgi:acyl-CoA thioesterase-1
MFAWMSWPMVAGVILVMTLAGRARGAEPGEATAKAGGTVKVLMFGDSLTQYGMAPATEKALKHLGGGWVAINGGKGGEAAEEGKARLPALLEKEKPVIVTVEYGWNDLAKNYKPKAFREHMEALIKMIQASGGAGTAPRIVLMTVTPLDPARHSFGTDKRLAEQGGPNYVMETQYNSILRELALEKGLGLVDMYRFAMTTKDPMALLVKDGIHLTPEAYAAIGGHVARAVFEFYRAEVLKDPKAVAERTRALAEVEAIKKSLAAGGNVAELRERSDKVWQACPYRAEIAALWQRITYPPGSHPPAATARPVTK